MAKIEDLIAQIPDERLRKGIAAEVKALKKTKKFGLVFEEHLPETVQLPKLPVKEGELVAKKRETGNELWRVKSIRKGIATLERAIEGYPLPSETGIEMPVAELVVVRSFGDPIYPALVPVDRVARGGPDKPWHMVINADNFHALQLLLYAYEGKVDVIYIDPPYNTGARDWKYNNDYVDRNDPWRHSKWLSMMQKRLKLAKRLLNPLDAVLIVTIDEKEYLRLGLLLEQVFPEAKIQMVSVVINPAGVTRPGAFSRTDEFIFFVFIGNASATPVPLGDEWRINPEDKRTTKILWSMLVRTGTNARRSDRPNLFYPIFVANDGSAIHSIGEPPALGVKRQTIKAPAGTVAVWPIRSDGSEGNWQASPPSLWKSYQEGFVRLGKFTDKGMSISYLKSGEQKKVQSGLYKIIGKRPDGSVTVENPTAAKRIIPTTAWRVGAHDASRHGSNLLKVLIPDRKFPFPKSLYAVEDALRFFVQDKPDALVLDFFGGSGTTTHAVARLNKQDGKRRRSILITNNEVSVDEAEQLRSRGLEPGDDEWEALGIFEYITRPRLTAAFTGTTPDGEPVSGDYKFADEFPMADGFDENVEFYRVDFLDPDEVARGDAFKAIVPVLWMLAGCRGEREDSKGTAPWFIPKHSPFAVLTQEKQFRAFREKLAERKDIEWVFLITDSEENFGQMRRRLGRKYECVQLYKSYLENFRINTQDALNG
jgi:adenine-specific DNA-methyltransferase